MNWYLDSISWNERSVGSTSAGLLMYELTELMNGKAGMLRGLAGVGACAVAAVEGLRSLLVS